MWFQINLNFAADVFYLSNVLHSFFRQSLTALCIYPCSSPWETWPPFCVLCSSCTEQGLKQSQHRTGMSSSSIPPSQVLGGVLSGLPLHHPLLCVWQCLPLVSLEAEAIILLVLCRMAAATEKLRSNPALPRSTGILSVLQVQSSRSGRQFCQGKSHLWYQSGGVSPWGSPRNPRIPPPQFYPRKGWEDLTHEF